MKALSGFGLPKSHRLASTKLLQEVFASKHSIKRFPIIFQYCKSISTLNDQFVPVVSKKKFKKAVDRNRIKRQLRELWRCNKHQINSISHKPYYVLAAIYVAKEKLHFSIIEIAFLKAIQELNENP